MWTATLQHKTRGTSDGGGYKGIPIFAGYKLHEKAFELFTHYVPNKKARVLILGAGAGAFDQRLIDHGYTNLLAVEYHKDLYIPKSEVVSKDLNKDFDDLGAFDAVVAIEIIEHIENHFHFVRQIKGVLKPLGVALITTPNVESPISRIKFFLRGDLSCFSEKEVRDTGHINPIFTYIFKTHLEAVGLVLLQHAYSTTLWDKKQFSGWKQRIIMALFRALTVLMKNTSGGQLSLFVCKKSKK